MCVPAACAQRSSPFDRRRVVDDHDECRMFSQPGNTGKVRRLHDLSRYQNVVDAGA